MKHSASLRNKSIRRLYTPRLVIGFCALVVLFGGIFPMGARAQENLTTVFELQLQYDSVKQELSVDTQSQGGYVLTSGTLSSTVPTSFAEYFGTIYSGSGNALYEFGFSHPEIFIVGKPTPLSVRVPYFPNAERIDVYRGSKKLLTIDVAPSASCKEDGRCDMEFGENVENCPTDCENVTPPPPPTRPSAQPVPPRSPITPSAMAPGGVPANTPTESEARAALPLIFFALGLISFGIWMYMKWRNTR